MRTERIVLIYPTGAEANELKDWLKPFGSLVQIVTFTDLRQAVPLVEKFPCDLLIVADRFPEAQGAILLKGLRKLCPRAQVIMLASDPAPIPELKAIAKTNLDIQYFPKPWDQQGLLAHIEASIGKEAPSFATALALDEEQAQRIGDALENLLTETSALSIYMVTELGQVLDYRGSQFERISEVSSLLGGSFAALQQVRNTLGDKGAAADLIHSQGQTEDLYAFSVGSQALLVLRFSAGPSAPKVGTVVFYTRQTVVELNQILVTSSSKPTKPFPPEELGDSLEKALEQLFAEGDPQPSEPDQLMTFQEAVKRGLVSKGLLDRWQPAGSVKPDEFAEGDSR